MQRYKWSCLELNGSAEVPFLWRSSRGGGGFELHKEYGQCKANLQTSCRISLAVDLFNDQDNEDDDTEDEGDNLLTRCRQGSQAEPISIHFLELPVARRIGIGGMFGIVLSARSPRKFSPRTLGTTSRGCKTMPNLVFPYIACIGQSVCLVETG